jgi:V8-like Glu-specific endopeptidase
VGWLRRGLELSNAICRLKASGGAGTGFMLGDGLVLTNHHVLSSESEADAAEVHFGYEEDERRRLQSGHRYRVAPGSWRASEEFDCAVVRLIDDGAKPLESWGRVELGGGTPLRVGDHVTIVQHPEGGAKQIAMTANQVVNVFGHLLHYSTDTMPGSSGSPVFDDKWRVVALHHAGGNLLKNARGERIFANEGVLIEAVVKALELGVPRA